MKFIMKTKLTLFFIALLSVLLVNAQLIKNDFLTALNVGESIEKDVYLSLAQGTSNPIKANQWNLVNATSYGGASPLVTEALTYNGYIGSGTENYSFSLLKLGTGGRKSIYSLTDQTIYSKGTYYLAFLINVGSNTIAGDNAPVISFDGTYCGNYQRISVCVKAVTRPLTFQFGVAGAATTADPAVYATTIYDFGTTYLVVLKYNFEDGKAELFVNPAISKTEPASLASITNTNLSTFGIRAVTIPQRTYFSAKIGSLRFAKTWQDALYNNVPGTPTIGIISSNDSQLAVAFTAPSMDGTITNYKYSTDGGSTFTSCSPAQTKSPIIITGLTNGTSYNVQIKAVNATGEGPATSSITAIPNIKLFPSLGKNVDLFIWAGQSNAEGWQGDGAYYPEDSLNSDQFIGLNYTSIDNTSSLGKWITMQPQDGHFQKGHFGPEVSFSRKLKEAGYNPAIFKYTKGSTSIYSFWKTPDTGGQYDSLVIKLKKAITVLEQKGFTVTIRGFIWIQGESDAYATTAPQYYSSLLSIVKDIRSNVAKDSNLPVILGVDEQQYNVVLYPLIVESQQRIASEEINCVFTSMYGLPKADGTHLTPTGLITHGIRIYDAFKSITLTQKKEVKNTDYKLYVTENILFVNAQGKQLELSVFDVLGHLIASKLSHNGTIELPINKGCYVIKGIINGQQLVNNKILF